MPSNKPEIEIAIAKYQFSNERNILESEAQWNRSNSFLIFNTILIAAITLSYQKDVNLPVCLTIFLPIAGLIVCGLWYSMNSRGFKWIKHWITSARKIEETYLSDYRTPADLEKYDLKGLNPVVWGREIQDKDKSFLNSERSTNLLIIVIAVIYILFFFFAAGLSISKTRVDSNQPKQTHW